MQTANIIRLFCDLQALSGRQTQANGSPDLYKSFYGTFVKAFKEFHTYEVYSKAQR